MTKHLSLTLPVRGHGQHVGAFALDASTPPLFVADRIWARRHAVLGNTALYFVEYWGESTSLNNGLAVLAEAAGGDPPYALHPSAVFGTTPPEVTLTGETLDVGLPELTKSEAAWCAKYQLHGSHYSGVVRVTIPARHPLVYCSATVKRLSKGPSGIPAALQIGFQGAIPVNWMTQFVDCTCRSDAAVRAVHPTQDAETQHALSNAAASPLAVAVMAVLP